MAPSCRASRRARAPGSPSHPASRAAPLASDPTSRAATIASHAARRSLDRGFLLIPPFLRPTRRTGFPFALGCAVALFSTDVRSGPSAASSGSSGSSAAPAADAVPELEAAARAIASDRSLEGRASASRLSTSIRVACWRRSTSTLRSTLRRTPSFTLPEPRSRRCTASTATRPPSPADSTATPSAGPRAPRIRRSLARDRRPLVAGAGAQGVRGGAGRGRHRRRPGVLRRPDDAARVRAAANEWASFRAPISAVALDENCVTLTVRPSGGGGQARVEFDPPGFVDVDGSIRTTASGRRRHGGARALAERRAPRRQGQRGDLVAIRALVRYTRRAEDPRLLAGYALQALLEKAGVKVSGGVKLGTGARTRAREAPLGAALVAPLFARKAERQLLRRDDLPEPGGRGRRAAPRRAPTPPSSSGSGSIASARSTRASS